jgi:hypothetical protein
MVLLCVKARSGTAPKVEDGDAKEAGKNKLGLRCVEIF